MKYLKSIYSVLEKQLKIFPDDNTPDNLKDIGMKYLKNRVSKYDKKGTIKHWDDGKKFLEENLIKTALEVIDEEDNFEENLESKINHTFYFYNDKIYDYIIEEYSDEIEDNDENNKKWYSIDDYEDAVEYLEGFNIDITDSIFLKNFAKYLVKNTDVENIFDIEEYDSVLSWTSGYLTKDETGNRYVYRSMMLPYKLDDIENINETGVGIFWSYVPEGAEPHNARNINENEIILKAIVEPNDVNWDITLHKSLYSLKEEKEIELLKGTSIEIIEFKINSNHPIVKSLYDKDLEYLKSLGIDSPYNLVQNKGEIIVKLEEPIIVRT